MIKKVSLVNFKNHAESEYEFLPGINAIVGPGGSGKTAIIDAIGWAMFGHLPGKKSDIIRSGEDIGFVEIEFMSSVGHVRVLKNFTGLSCCYLEDRCIADGEMAVREVLSEVLGVRSTKLLFANLIGVTQGGIDAPFLVISAIRAKTFARIMGVEKYRLCADWLLGALHELDKGLLLKKEQLSNAASSMQGASSAEENIKECRAVIEQETKIISRLKGEERRLETVVNLRKKILGLRSERGTLNDFIEKDLSRKALESLGGHVCPDCGTFVYGARHTFLEKKYASLFDKVADAAERVLDLGEQIDISEHVIAGFVVADAGNGEDALKSVSSERNLALGEMRVMEGRIDAYEDVLRQSEEINLPRLEEACTFAVRAIEILEVIRSACRDLHQIMAKNTTVEVSSLATFFAKMIYEDWEIFWKDDFSIEVKTDQGLLPLSSLSKSQKAIASLSVVLALAKTLSPVPFILLDEPTANMDSNQVSLVTSAISQCGWFEQVILTTHRVEAEHVFGNVIEVGQ